MKKLLLILLLPIGLAAQNTFKTAEVDVNATLKGTLYTPDVTKKTPLLILFSGSGPTDRDGNQPGVKSDNLKLLAEASAKQGIAVYSFDKRIIAMINSGNIDETKLSFDDYVKDAKDVITFFKNQKKYSKIVLGGHSEGSLVAILATTGYADALISIAGPGRSIDKIITEQVAKQAPNLQPEIEKYFGILKKGETFKLEDQTLAMLFRESVQPYMISWMKYDPVAEIKKIKVPTLIINGSKDIQVGESEAQLLKAAKPDAKIVIVPDMNHIFKTIKGDESENYESYNKPELPISEAFVSAVNSFIKTL
ncbi:alpha/beta fold hydrolase [Flavobacterium sp.]|uniref:alpha/beta hydrolase family protein n=1 Tax=Flavobacterium sp. TaxID=239 RepID=UPI001224BB54|nr:alpha/beta fold hydrolase [Flavobacterium sp.]RZJ70895.1 MAG: alpha/beta fold hydrolase [Flavobacterium sp.]